MHAYPWNEWFFFLEEEVKFRADDRVIQATRGYVIHLLAGVPHTFAITSPQAKFLVWVSNAAAEYYIEDLVQAEQERELAVEEVMAIEQAHQIKLVA